MRSRSCSYRRRGHPLGTTLLVIAAFLAASPAFARTWYVRPDGSGDAPTIQAGIDSSEFGDVVLVAAGTYVEPLVMGLGVTLRGESGAASTIVQALPGMSCIRCDAVHSVLLEGMTFTGGSGTLLGRRLAGGNVLVYQAQIEVRDCILRDGRLEGAGYADFTLGGGMACFGGSIVDVEGCTIEGNEVSADPEFGPQAMGGGIYVDETSELDLHDSRVTNNRGAGRGGGIFSDNPAFSAVNCRIESNGVWGQGGGFAGAGILRRCLVKGNSTGLYGSGGGVWVTRGTVEDCLVVRNTTGNHGGGGIFADTPSGDVTVRGNTVFGNTLFDPSGGIDGAGILVYWDPGKSGSIIVENNLVIAEGTPEISSGICLSGCAPPLVFRCNDSWGHAQDFSGCPDLIGENGNFSADPHFCDPNGDDFTLNADSPCLPGRHPRGDDCGLIGAFDAGCGSPTATDFTSWGLLKHEFGQ